MNLLTQELQFHFNACITENSPTLLSLLYLLARRTKEKMQHRISKTLMLQNTCLTSITSML
jgi:hypothetical protein